MHLESIYTIKEKLKVLLAHLNYVDDAGSRCDRISENEIGRNSFFWSIFKAIPCILAYVSPEHKGVAIII